MRHKCQHCGTPAEREFARMAVPLYLQRRARAALMDRLEQKRVALEEAGPRIMQVCACVCMCVCVCVITWRKALALVLDV